MKILLNNWILPLGWGIGQAFNWLIGIVVGGMILGGDIGGVIYTEKTMPLVFVGIGGLIGGFICGLVLSMVLRRNIPEFGLIDVLILVAAWMVAFGLGEVLYRKAQLANLGQFSGIVVFLTGILSSLLTGIIGGTATFLLSQSTLRQTFLGVGGWSIGLVVGFATGKLVVAILWLTLGFSVSFDIRSGICYTIGGFIYGFIGALFGNWSIKQTQRNINIKYSTVE